MRSQHLRVTVHSLLPSDVIHFAVLSTQRLLAGNMSCNLKVTIASSGKGKSQISYCVDTVQLFMRNKSRWLAPNKLIDKLWLNYVSTDNESSWHFSWKGTWRRFRGNSGWNAEVSDQYAILLKILNDYKIKRNQRSRWGILIAHTWLPRLSSPLTCSVLLKVDVSCGEKDPYFVL